MATHDTIRSLAAEEFSVSAEGTDVELTERVSGRLFKLSSWGLGVVPLAASGARATGAEAVAALKVTGIVEGTDIECASEALPFPLTSEAFWQACDRVSEALTDAKAEWDAQGDDDGLI